MAVKDAAPEDVAALPQDFAVPTYNANNQPLYDNQLFPAVNSAEDLVARGYATPDGQVTERGQMALSLKKVGALNDDYTLNDTGKTLMASRDDLLKEENIDLYREYKRLELDEAPDVGIWDSIKDIASKTVQGANVIAENELGGIKDIASSQIFGGAFNQYGAEALTPEKRAETRIETEEAAKDLFASSAGLARAAATEIDKVAAKTMWDGMMQDYQVSYLEQKYDRDLAEMEKVNTAEVADELAKVIGLETKFAEGRQQAEQLIGPEATQQAIEGGRAAGLTLSLVNPLAPEALAARVGFGVAQKGVTAAFKPIARKLLESENKAAQALAANQRVNGLNSHLAQTQYLAKSAEDQAVFAERQADKLSKMGIVDRANSARTLADNLRTKGLEAGARAQGLTDEIARASDEAAKLAQDATVADKINFVAQRARELPGMPLQAIGGLIEGTGKAMIGIDKGLSTLASKIGADKAWNAMNRISSLSGLGGAGAVMGLGPAAFVPAAIRTAWSTAPFLKGAGHFVRMIGKETANARELIPFWQRVANYETLGATQRSIAHLMDTSTLGSRVTGLAGDVAKGMAAAYPVDLAFQWISDGGEMDMNTLKQAAAETVVFGGTGAALGGITAASTDRIKKLQRGSALNFYRNIKDGGQRVAFNALNDGMKRSIGTYASSFPNLNIKFTDQGGGAFDKATNTAFINPMARNPLKPLLAHEINHYILVRNQMEGGVAAALVGDGVQTGGILRGKDGKLDENFQAFKDEYTRRLEAQHNRQVDTRIAAGEKIPARERTFTPPTDNDMAIEYFVDSMADDMMGMAESGELGKQAGRMLVTRKMQSLGNAILQQAPIIKDFFYKLGGATDKSGRAVYGNGLLAEGIREIPEMKKLFRKMISESAGRPMHVAKVTKGESDGHAIPIMGKDDPILNEMTSLWETNADGVPLRDKNGDYIPLSDQTEQLRASSGLMLLEDQQNRINRGETLEQGELRFNPEENAWTGEYLTDRQIQILRTSGRFNNTQLRQLDMLNGAAKENTGRRFLVFNQPATKKRKGKRVAYDTLGVSMREIVPYGIKITKDGNLLVRLMSVQQLHANAFEKAATKRGQALYKGNAEQILNDVNQVIENHGRNEPTDAYFKSRYGNEWEVRKNFINTVFGNVGKGQKDINPLLAAEKAKNAVVKTYRIDRINKATELEGRTNLPYQNHLVKVNFMPEGEPILDENGEPKDLRYTPSYEDSQVRMPEAQRAMPEGEAKIIESNIPDKEGGKMRPSTWDSLSKVGYSPEASEKTQIATTAPTYESIVKANATQGMEVLDFSAGRGIGTKAMKAIGKRVGFNVEGYEPFSNEKTRVVAPEYEGEDAINQIPDNSKDIIINNAVLNVVPEDTGRQIVNQIYSKLKPGGSAFINVMGWNNIKNRLDNPKTQLVGPREVVTQKGTFQKGYTAQSLRSLIEQELPDAKIVRTSHGDIGFKVTKPAPPAETMPVINQPAKTGQMRFLPEPVEKLSAFKGKRVQVLTSDLSLVGDVKYGSYTAKFQGGPGYLDNDGWAFTDKDAADGFVTRWERDGKPLIGLASLGSANHLNSLASRKAYAEKWKYLIKSGNLNKEEADAHIKEAMSRVINSDAKKVKPDWRNAAKMITNADDLSNYFDKIPWAAAPMFYEKLTAKTLPIKYPILVENGLDLESVANEYRQPEYQGADIGDLYAIAEYNGSTPEYRPDLNQAYPWRIKFTKKATLSEMHNVADLTTDPRAFTGKIVGGSLAPQPLMVTGIQLDKLISGDIKGSVKPISLQKETLKTKSNKAKEFSSGNPKAYKSYEQIMAERELEKSKPKAKGNASAIANAAKLK